MSDFPRGSPCPVCQAPIAWQRILGQEVQAMPCGHGLLSLTARPHEPLWVGPTPATMSEAQLQAKIIQWALAAHWKVYHVPDSRRSVPGFPDLELLRAPRLIKAELKREGEDPTPDQAAWLEAYRGVPGLEVYIWRPRDLPAIAHVLA